MSMAVNIESGKQSRRFWSYRSTSFFFFEIMGERILPPSNVRLPTYMRSCSVVAEAKVSSTLASSFINYGAEYQATLSNHIDAKAPSLISFSNRLLYHP
jgi:hypothetical protein